MKPSNSSSTRSSWKTSGSYSNGSYSSSGRHEHEHSAVSGSKNSHAVHNSHSSRDSRYRTSPYTRPRN